MMYRLVELEACQPAPVQLRPGRSVVVPPVAQQKPDNCWRAWRKVRTAA
jgi:hypothetical protein